MLSKQIKFSVKGQALLEIAITIGVAAVVIAAIAIITIVGLRNSQFAQNQAQATKLAQEGIERIRSMRGRNQAVCIDATSYYWSNKTPLVWGTSFGDRANCTFCKFKLTGDSACPLQQATTAEEIGGKFKRQIYIQDIASEPNRKKITSEVSWTDFSGSHKSELVTILANY